MSEPRNAEARRLIGDQLDELHDRLTKVERRRMSLRTQTTRADAERERLNDEIVGLGTALEALGGRLDEASE
jgi:predicted  nucleic acid-binding Zn-ribbon protein